MNLTLLDTKIIQLINQYSINGTLTTTATLQDYLLRTRNLIDACQKEIATRKKIPKALHIFQNTIPNQIPGLLGQQLYQHLNQDITFTAFGTKAFVFEVNGPCTMTVEVNGVTQEDIALSLSTTEMTEFKDFVETLTTDEVTLRFSGLYPFNIQNIGMYAYDFAKTTDIPQYRAYNIYPLPVDCMELRNIKTGQYPSQYINIKDFYIEGNNILINSFADGNLVLNYYKYPTTITKDTPEETELEVSIDAQELIPLYVAAHVYLEDNPTIGTTLLNEYQNKFNNLFMVDINKSQTSITNGWCW